jgi:hypothetical protein
MKIKNNKPTRSASNAHEGQTAADTNSRNEYKIIFLRAQRSYGNAVVEAASLDEARQKASKIAMYEVEHWNISEDEMSVDSVEPVEGGRDDE